MTCSEAIQIIAQHRPELMQYKVKSLAIFGSVARNQAGPSSDIDLLVEFAQPVGMFEFMDLKDFLERILKTKVDLVTEPALKKQMKGQILRELVRAA